ncbi:MAG: HNH endonuclease signature motif containing protein [Micrococcus sp.]|nr:HNH endonuclease signature motif containing protein [Micrococcus sp.]
MVFRDSKNWTDGNRTWDRKSDAQRAETYEHLEIKSGQLSDMAAGQKAVRSTGDVEITQKRSGLGFTDTVARQQKRSDFLDPESILQKEAAEGLVLNETMRARVISELEAEARADKGHDRRAAAETWEELPPYLQERAVRRAMRDYDLDHVRDLQFGGTDTADNLQWLERSANRAVGAQSKVHRERFDYETSEDADAFDEKSRVSKVSLKVGR